MNPEQDREETLFDAARELTDPRACAAFLDAACQGEPDLRRRVEALLQARGKADGFFDKGPPEPAILRAEQKPMPATVQMFSGHSPGDRIGRYKLLQQIGEGGGGIV
jgi:hypothetical protein